MLDFKIHVIQALSAGAPEARISGLDFPTGVNGSFSVYNGWDISTPWDTVTLVLTDDTALVHKLLCDKPDRLRVVFIGASADAEPFEASLEDIWPCEGADAIRRRLFRLVRALKNEYDLWFYQNALLTAIDTVPDMLWFKRADGVHTLVNDAFTKIVHKEKADIHGKDHFDVWDVPRPDEGSAEFACAESEEIAISSGKMYVCEETVKTSDGMKLFTTYKSPVYDMFGTIFGTVGVGHDVTNFNNLGTQLSLLMENLPYPICIFTPDWQVVRMNSAFAALAEVRADEDHARFDYRAWKNERLALQGVCLEDPDKHSITAEYQILFGGETRLFVVTELEIRNSSGEVAGFLSAIEDITYRRAYEQSIISEANTDILTGLYNRRYFDSFVRGNTGKPSYLLYMDLDRFKAINDAYGHNTGDDVLIEIAELIREFFPRAVAARLGGDEFVVVDEDHDRAYLDHRCEVFQESVTAALKKYGSGASISIGISHTDGSQQDIERALRESDEHMYRVKREHHAR